MQNIEIKSSVSDPAAMERRIAALVPEPVWEHRQRDVFFNVPRGYLKLRTVTAMDPPGPPVPGELIAYVREPGTEPRASDYHIARTAAPGDVETALTRSLGVRGIVEKTRRLYLHGHTRIHLDVVSGLGTFLELETVIDGITREAAEAEARRVIAALDLDPAAFLDRPYLELLERHPASARGRHDPGDAAPPFRVK
jgi:adenylate cyclase class IV